MKTSRVKSRKVGRPLVGSKSLHVKVPPKELADIDEWIKRQPIRYTRPAAMREIVKQALKK